MIKVFRAVGGRIYRAVPARLQGGLLFLLLRAVGSVPSHRARLFVYQQLGMTVGRSSHIYGGLEVRDPDGVTIGTGSIIGHNVILDGRGQLRIGDNVNVSSEVAIWTMTHDPQSPTFASTTGAVVVERDSWLGFRCIVLPGVTVGRGAVVASGAVVTKDVAPFDIVAGVPARPVGRRGQTIDYDLGADDAHLAFV